MGAAVRMGVQGDGPWLGFDLAEVLAAVGPHPDLTWVLRDSDIIGDSSAVWPDGRAVLDEARSETELRLTWAEMERLAEVCIQVIDGCFTGYDEAGEPRLQLEAIDSSYWVVWARDAAVLDRVRRAFAVDDYEEPTPAPLR